jgi:acetolactate synthase-1/2/3 large subunit
VPAEATILTDGGSFARWVHRYYRFSRAHSQAGPISGAMGYAVPGAIGALLARPDRPVVAFVGDGGFMMTGQELVTAVEQNLAIKVIVCDNGAHGSILQGQTGRFGSHAAYGTRLRSPDFAAVAEAYGVRAWRVERTAAFDAAFAEALAHDGPALLHLLTDERDIVPYGAEREAV